MSVRRKEDGKLTVCVVRCGAVLCGGRRAQSTVTRDTKTLIGGKDSYKERKCGNIISISVMSICCAWFDYV